MRRRMIVLTAVLAVIAAACGGGAAVPGDDGTLEITLSEFQFEPSDVVLHPGDTVTLVIDNQGEKEHEFMIGQTVRMHDGAPDGFESDFFETVESLTVDPSDAAMGMAGLAMEGTGSDTTMGMGEGSSGDVEMDEDHGFMVMRDPSTTARVTFTVTEDSIGEWQIGCFEEDGAHWDNGMQGTLTVEDA